jgi:hypothetical protein
MKESKEQIAFSEIKRIVLMAVGKLKVELPIEETKLIDKLVEKSIPMKPYVDYQNETPNGYNLCCGNCDRTFLEIEIVEKIEHCRCGQALDWSDEQ